MTLSLVSSEQDHDTADAALLRNLAEVHQKFGIHKTATNLLHLCLWIDRDDVEALRLLARSAFKTHDFASVLNCFKRIEDRGASLSDAENMMRVSALVLSGGEHR